VTVVVLALPLVLSPKSRAFWSLVYGRVGDPFESLATTILNWLRLPRAKALAMTILNKNRKGKSYE
ncbi:MAG: hypothetical protein IIZ32_05535, partial [Ruminococcus sp.]|nr:hypothetical protein [Ruminococcus sp.]